MTVNGWVIITARIRKALMSPFTEAFSSFASTLPSKAPSSLPSTEFPFASEHYEMNSVSIVKSVLLEPQESCKKVFLCFECLMTLISSVNRPKKNIL